jgi:hypothetical protein
VVNAADSDFTFIPFSFFVAFNNPAIRIFVRLK